MKETFPKIYVQIHDSQPLEIISKLPLIAINITGM